jgi:hypothetical protein
MVKETPEDLEPEVRQRIYKLPRLGIRFSPDWLLEIQGIFAEVQKNPRNSLSSCKPSPLGV